MKPRIFCSCLICLVWLFGLAIRAAAQSTSIGVSPQTVADQFVPSPADLKTSTWVDGLEAPWSLVFLPDGRALVSERPGRIRLIVNGKLQPTPWATIKVRAISEGGLMGLAVHPDFPAQPYVYAMYTYESGGGVYNRVIRLRDQGATGEFDAVILDMLPGGNNHNGGRVAFGPDGKLYITAGETMHSALAQDLRSLGGKILRVNPDGTIPADNPFPGSAVWTYGHRNPQGLAWQAGTGRLFASEHGPTGEFGLYGRDEINQIQPGKNYGWPLATGAARQPQWTDPVIMWPPATPPSGMAFWQGDLYVSSLRSQALIRIRFAADAATAANPAVISIERLFARDGNTGAWGRLRDAVVGPDQALYVLTNNRDGRGSPKPGDDRILRITR